MGALRAGGLRSRAEGGMAVGGGAGALGAPGARTAPAVPARQPCAPSGRWVARRDRRRPRGRRGRRADARRVAGRRAGGTPTVAGGRVCGCIAGGGPAPGIIGRGTFWAAGPGAPVRRRAGGFEGGREGGGRASGGGPRWIAIATEDRSGSARAGRTRRDLRSAPGRGVETNIDRRLKPRRGRIRRSMGARAHRSASSAGRGWGGCPYAPAGGCIASPRGRVAARRASRPETRASARGGARA